MSGIRARLERVQSSEDRGFTLIEMIVTATIMMIIGAVLLSMVVAATKSSRDSRAQHDMNEEARTALNRMARELRQASSLAFAVNPDGPAYSATSLTAVSFKADFNGDGCSGNSAPCPTPASSAASEEVTYCFDPSAPSAVERDRLWLIPSVLTAAPSTCSAVSGAQPILAAHVSKLMIEYRSNQYRYDTNPTDGITTWRELDDAPPPVGDGGSDGNINTNAINGINSVVLNLDMSEGGHTQHYVTQIDLRNRP